MTDTALARVMAELRSRLRRWLVTGCAGFIGSNLLEALLRLDQHVVGVDNFATGFQHNLDEVASLVGWLSGDHAGMVTGSSYVMDGGWSAK